MIRVGPPFARVGGLAVAAVALVPAAIHARRFFLVSETTVAVFGALLPLAVTLAVAGYGVSLARRDTDGERTRAAVVGVVGGTVLAGVVFLWMTVGGIIQYQSMAPLPVILAHLLTAGLAVGGLLGVSRVQSQRTRRLATDLFSTLPNPTARVRRGPDGEREVVDVNDAFLQTFGPDRPHIGSPLSACLRPADGQSDVSTVLEEEVAARSHLACGVAGGGDGVREFRVSRVEIGGSDEEFVVLTDVTEQQRRERRLSVLNRVLRHDLRTAVNVIDGQASILADAVGERGASALDAISEQTDGLLRLSTRARQLETVLSGEVSVTTTDLTELVGERVAAFEQSAPAVTVERSLPSEPIRVRDNGLLGNAIDEVLQNVAEHAGESPTAWISVETEGAMATLTVADDGPGLPDTEGAVVDRTLESDLDHASGVGLWFTTWVVVELDGEVTVESGADADDGGVADDEREGGTTVKLHVPLAEDAVATAERESTAVAGDEDGSESATAGGENESDSVSSETTADGTAAGITSED
ncbi:MAG: sensor histidine kinase [Halobaculum sp.]